MFAGLNDVAFQQLDPVTPTFNVFLDDDAVSPRRNRSAREDPHGVTYTDRAREAPARLCFAEARRHRDQPLGPGPLAQDAAVLARVGDPIAITLAVFDEGCVGEGVSAAIAGLAAEACRDEPTAALLRRICADESRHAALAWKTLRWLLDRFGDRVATPLRARLATLTVPPVPHTPHPDLRAHGRLAPRECATIHRAVLRRVVRPLADTLLSQPAHLHAEEQRA